MELIKEYAEGEHCGPQACRLKETPRSVTNKFSSATESLALYNLDIKIVESSIERIRAWLHILDEDEKHIITKRYIYNLKINKIIDSWNVDLTDDAWHKIRRNGIRRILNYEKYKKQQKIKVIDFV
jgi:hypothetical protein